MRRQTDTRYHGVTRDVKKSREITASRDITALGEHRPRDAEFSGGKVFSSKFSDSVTATTRHRAIDGDNGGQVYRYCRKISRRQKDVSPFQPGAAREAPRKCLGARGAERCGRCIWAVPTGAAASQLEPGPCVHTRHGAGKQARRKTRSRVHTSPLVAAARTLFREPAASQPAGRKGPVNPRCRKDEHHPRLLYRESWDL